MTAITYSTTTRMMERLRALDTRVHELLTQNAKLERLIMTVGNGTVTSGSIIGTNQAGTPNTSFGSWAFTPSATKP